MARVTAQNESPKPGRPGLPDEGAPKKSRVLFLVCAVVALLGYAGVLLFRLPTGKETIPAATVAASGIHSAGSFTLLQTQTVDLDTGATRGGQTDDLWFEAVIPSRRYLTPIHGAVLGLMPKAPGVGACLMVKLSRDRIDVSQLKAGTRICALTNEFRHSELTIEEAVPSGSGRLTVTYTTWNR